MSLVVATVGRQYELARLLDSLSKQTVNNIEVLIIDQNQDDRLRTIVHQSAEKLLLRWVRTAPGLSRARNQGIKLARGEIVGFPDDDCWYETDTVEQCILRLHQNQQLEGITGITLDAESKPSAGRFDKYPGLVDSWNVWRRGNSATLFCHTTTARLVGGFDESLGVGSETPWGSGEETDFILRCLAAGAKIMFDPSFIIRHPQTKLDKWNPIRRRFYSYGRGHQRVLIKHCYPFAYRMRSLLRPILASAYYIATARPLNAYASYCTFAARALEEGCNWTNRVHTSNYNG